MRDPVRVLLLGTGRMGCAIARLLLERPGLELVGVYARRAERAGRDVGSVLGLDQPILPVPSSNTLTGSRMLRASRRS